MIFKRRDKRGTGRLILESVYPPGGWGRAFNYVYHRLRRLPDPPHRIARGMAAGVFITFTPLFGAHIPLAALIAWSLRGNVIAGMLGTLFGNPLTFPFIAALCLSTGHWILGANGDMGLHGVSEAFSRAGGELWWNIRASVSDRVVHWGYLIKFWREVFLPYLLGGMLWGSLAAVGVYALAHPLIDAYQRRRSRLLQARLKRRLKPAGTIVAE